MLRCSSQCFQTLYNEGFQDSWIKNFQDLYIGLFKPCQLYSYILNSFVERENPSFAYLSLSLFFIKCCVCLPFLYLPLAITCKGGEFNERGEEGRGGEGEVK